ELPPSRRRSCLEHRCCAARGWQREPGCAAPAGDGIGEVGSLHAPADCARSGAFHRSGSGEGALWPDAADRPLQDLHERGRRSVTAEDAGTVGRGLRFSTSGSVIPTGAKRSGELAPSGVEGDLALDDYLLKLALATRRRAERLVLLLHVDLLVAGALVHDDYHDHAAAAVGALASRVDLVGLDQPPLSPRPPVAVEIVVGIHGVLLGVLLPGRVGHIKAVRGFVVLLLERREELIDQSLFGPESELVR